MRQVTRPEKADARWCEPSLRTPCRAIVWLLLVLLVSCTAKAPPQVDGPSQQEPLPLDGWSKVSLPGGVTPSSLASLPGAALVGGRTGAEHPRPSLVRVSARGSLTQVALQPASPYARVADIVSLDTDGRRIVAVGAAHGGAHANFRWTVWSGNTGRLTEFPQAFETFGGQSAGSLLDIVLTTEGPAVAGTWVGQYGLDAAIWLPSGTAWQRESSTGTALANIKARQVAPRSAIGRGAGMVIAGSVIGLTNGVRQAAAVWTSPSRKGPWRLVELPDPGSRSEAMSTRCGPTTCWISGHADGRLALWTQSSSAGAVRVSQLPDVGIDTDGPGPRTLLLRRGPGVMFTGAGSAKLLVGTDRGWRLYAGPPGTVMDATTVGGRLFTIVQRPGQPSQLWQCDLIAAGLG